MTIVKYVPLMAQVADSDSDLITGVNLCLEELHSRIVQ